MLQTAFVTANVHWSIKSPLFHSLRNPSISPRFKQSSLSLPSNSHLANKGQLRMSTSLQSQPDEDLIILTYPTEPIEGQKTGTSGMRKKTQIIVSTPTFLPNWIQSLFNALGGPSVLSGSTLILGGDGRYYNKVAAQTILRLAAANGVARVIVGQEALLTTPAVSSLIPLFNAIGGIILTASHNPAGIDADWGIKYNTSSGAPALDALTSKIYQETLEIKQYQLADLGGDVDVSVTGETSFAGGKFVVEVIDPVDRYIQMLSNIFDFDAIRDLITRSDFSLLFNAMHASTGEYAYRLFEDVLKAPPGCVMHGTPLEDFGGGHPDPNLTYAAQLVDILDPNINDDAPQFGAASDGDGDRNMILGRGVFVSPGDSVSIIADYAEKAIPYFSRNGVVGVARSMPTSSAIDRVAKALNVRSYETPTGWKYFTNLMDAGKINICGEESFGTGSDHIREKDGLWAVLSWLSILAYENRGKPVGKLVTVEDILISHWRKYGRTYNMRYDYENVKPAHADILMINLEGMALRIVPINVNEVESMEIFEYKDPVDGTIAENQGIIVRTSDGGRIVFRLSGTGSAGATLRIYFEKYEAPSDSLSYKDVKTEFESLAKVALDLARVEEMIERTEPTVIT